MRIYAPAVMITTEVHKKAHIMVSPKKFIAAATTFCFIFTSILSPALEAAIAAAPAGSLAAQQPLSDALIPDGIGSVTASRDFNSDRTVILIQDLHCHPEVQKNINSIIAALDKKYTLPQVYVEGASGAVDTSWLARMSDARVREQLAAALVESGRLTGAEYYSITAAKPRLLTGLEDEQLHRENIVRLGTILGRKKQFETVTARLDADMDILRMRYLGRKNNKLNALARKYADKKISPRKYYALLMKYVDQVNAQPDRYHTLRTIRLSRYPNLTAYRDSTTLEPRINPGRIAAQTRALLRELRATLPFSAYNELVAQSGNFSNTGALYAALARIVHERAIPVSRRYPDVARYIAFLEKRNAVNPVALIAEEQRLLEELRIAFSRDISEVEISFLSDFYGVFKDYLFNRLSADDYDYFVARFEKFKTIWAKYNYADHLQDAASSFPLLDAYYQVNNTRSERFVEAVTRQATPGVTVLVTGGFHAAEMQRMLEERRISYRTITPRITVDTAAAGAEYQAIISEQAKIFTSQALSSRLFTQMNAAVWEVPDGFIIRYNTGERIEVYKDKTTGKITLKSALALSNEPLPAATRGIADAIQLGAEQALATAQEQWNIINGMFPGTDLVSFTALTYFLARKGMIDSDGLVYEIDHSDAATQQDILAFFGQIIGKTADVNQLGRMPGFVQKALVRRVSAMKQLNDMPAYIRAVDRLFDLLIRVNSRLEYESTKNPTTFAANHPAIAPRSAAALMTRVLAFSSFSRPLNTALHSWWNRRFWGRNNMLAGQSEDIESRSIPIEDPRENPYNYARSLRDRGYIKEGLQDRQRSASAKIIAIHLLREIATGEFHVGSSDAFKRLFAAISIADLTIDDLAELLDVLDSTITEANNRVKNIRSVAAKDKTIFGHEPTIVFPEDKEFRRAHAGDYEKIGLLSFMHAQLLKQVCQFEFDVDRIKQDRPELNIDLLVKMLREGKIDVDEDLAIEKTEVARGFLNNLRKKGLSQTAVVGGTVRDILTGSDVSDFDVGLVQEEISDADRGISSFPPEEGTRSMWDAARAALDQLSKVFNREVVYFLRAGIDNAPNFHGVVIEWCGPLLIFAQDTVLRQMFGEKASSEMYPSGSAPTVLGVAIDANGNVYGRRGLLDLLMWRIVLRGTSSSYTLGAVIRTLRLHYQFGLSLDSTMKTAIKESMNSYLAGVRPVGVGDSAIAHRQLNKIRSKIGAEANAVLDKDLDALGVRAVIDKAEQYAKRMTQVITYQNITNDNLDVFWDRLYANPDGLEWALSFNDIIRQYASPQFYSEISEGKATGIDLHIGRHLSAIQAGKRFVGWEIQALKLGAATDLWQPTLYRLSNSRSGEIRYSFSGIDSDHDLYTVLGMLKVLGFDLNKIHIENQGDYELGRYFSRACAGKFADVDRAVIGDREFIDGLTQQMISGDNAWSLITREITQGYGYVKMARNGKTLLLLYGESVAGDAGAAFMSELKKQGVNDFVYWGTAAGLQPDQRYGDSISASSIHFITNAPIVEAEEAHIYFDPEETGNASIVTAPSIFEYVKDVVINAKGGIQAIDTNLYYLGRWMQENPGARLRVFLNLSDVLSWQGHSPDNYSSLSREEKEKEKAIKHDQWFPQQLTQARANIEGDNSSQNQQAHPMTETVASAIQNDSGEGAIPELLAKKLDSATAIANRFVADVDLSGIGTITPVNALRGANLVVVGYQGRAPPPEYISFDAVRNEIALRYEGLEQFTDDEIGLKLLHAAIMLAAQQAARVQAIPWTPELSEQVSKRADEVVKTFEQTARVDAARAVDVTRQGFVALSSRDAAGTIFDIDDGSARGTIYEGQGAVAYLQSMSGKPFPHETAVVVPQGSAISVDDQLVDHEGAVYIPQGGSVRLHDFTGPLYVIQMTQIPRWYETKRFTREAFPQVWEQINGFNDTGIVYKNRTGVTVFKLSDRRNVWTGGPTEWLLDSVSGDEQSVCGPSFGISMVNYEMGDGTDFHLMRPAEWLHNHPSHGDDSMTEIYMCLSGTMEVAVFRDERWYVNKLTPGMIMVMRPNIDHAVIKGSGHYKHIAIQFPSTFQYGFDFSNKHTPLPVLQANIPSLYNALWRVESNGLNDLGVHHDSSVPIADKQARTEFRWKVRTTNQPQGSGFALSMGISVERALHARPRLRRLHASLPAAGKAVLEALAAVFMVPFIEEEDIVGALASADARERFLRAHDDTRRSARFNTAAGRLRRAGLRVIGGAMRAAAPFGPGAVRWANIGTHMAYNALAVPLGMTLARADAAVQEDLREIEAAWKLADARQALLRRNRVLINEYLDRIGALLDRFYRAENTPVTFEGGKDIFFGVGSVRSYFDPRGIAPKILQEKSYKLFADAVLQTGVDGKFERVQGVITRVNLARDEITVVDAQGMQRTIPLAAIADRDGRTPPSLALTINSFMIPDGYDLPQLAQFMAHESAKLETRHELKAALADFRAKMASLYEQELPPDIPLAMLEESRLPLFLDLTLTGRAEDISRLEKFANGHNGLSAILPKHLPGAVTAVRSGEQDPAVAAGAIVALERFWRSMPIVNLLFPLMHIPAGRSAVLGSAMVVASAYLPAALLAGAVSTVCAVPAVIAAALAGYGIGIWAAGRFQRHMDTRYLRGLSAGVVPDTHPRGIFKVVNAIRMLVQHPGAVAGTRLTLRDFLSLANEYVVNQVASTRAGDRFLQWLANRRQQHRPAILPAAMESIREKINNNEPVAIVTVCTANKNRSVLMDFILRAWLTRNGKGNVSVRSAGLLVNLLGNSGAPLSSTLRSVLMHPSSEFGVDDFFDDFTTEQFTAKHADADLFLAASQQHKNILMQRYNIPSEKILLFADLSPGLSTAFPYGMPDPDRLSAPRILAIANIVKIAVELFFDPAAQQRTQSSTGSTEEPPDAFSAIGLHRRPSVYLPGDARVHITPELFAPRYFSDAVSRDVLAFFAQHMGPIECVVSPRIVLPARDRTAGFSVVSQPASPGQANIVRRTRIVMADDISFVQLLNLVALLYEDMLRESSGKSGAYRAVLQEKYSAVEGTAKCIIYAAEYLAEHKQDWLRQMNLPQQDAQYVEEFIDTLISGFRAVTAGYHIKRHDTHAKRLAIAESWLGVDTGFFDEVRHMPPQQRSAILAQRFNEHIGAWAENIQYELGAPVRLLEIALLEMGGRLLDGIGSIAQPSRLLTDEIDGEIAQATRGMLRGEPEFTDAVIAIVQRKVEAYFQKGLYSDSPNLDSAVLQAASDRLNTEPIYAAISNEISIPTIVEVKHMSCVMKSYLCGRILQQLGLQVYWLGVQEDVDGIQEGHVALLVQKPDGVYQIVDASIPHGAGDIPAQYIGPGEIANNLRDSIYVTKELDASSSRMHHTIRITNFDTGVLSGIFNTIGQYYFLNGQQFMAESSLRKSLRFGPGNANAWLNLGSVLLMQGKRVQGLFAWRTILKINPKDGLVIEYLRRYGDPALPAILAENSGPYLRTVGKLRRFMPMAWARVIGLSIVHAKEYSWLKPLMDERTAESAAAAFDAAHGAPSETRREAIRAMGEAGRRAGRHVRWTGLSPLVQFIVSGIAHVRYDITATLPMAVITAEDGVAGADASAARAKGYMPLVVRRLSPDTPGLRRGGRKGVWVTTENGVLTAHLAVNEGKGETFAGRAADYIGALKGYGQVQGAQGLVKALEHTGGHRLNTRALAVVSGIRLMLPAWQDIVVKTSGASLASWDVESNVRHAQRYAAAPEIGLVSRWSPALAEIPQFNRSLVLTPDELNKAGKDNVRLLQGRGARVYALYDGSNADEARALIQEFGLNGLIGTNEALPAESIAPANADTMVASPARHSQSVRALREINLSDPAVAERVKQIHPGSVVRVRLGGQEISAEQLAALNGLSSSTILILESDEVKKEGVTRDITEIMFCGVNLLSLLALTPQTLEEKQRYQRTVAYGIEIGTFEQYADEAAVERDIAAMATRTVPAHNRKFAHAVRLHLDGVKDPALRTEFLAAVAERLRARQALAEAGKHNDLENPALEQLFGAMVAKNVQHKPSETTLKRNADLSSDRSESHESFGVKLFNEIQALRARAEQNNDPEAIGTIIALIKLYAEERLYASLSERDTSFIKADAAKAILEAA